MRKPVVLCIGTNNVVGDSLGPKVGDLLVMKYNINAYVYGISSRPITGNNYKRYINHIELHHSNNIIIAIDACVGKREDIGKIKYSSNGIFAGSALEKKYTRIGDIGIMGIVASSSENNMEELLKVEKSLVDRMSNSIAGIVYGITNFVEKFTLYNEKGISEKYIV